MLRLNHTESALPRRVMFLLLLALTHAQVAILAVKAPRSSLTLLLALLGVAVGTAVVMLLRLRMLYEEAQLRADFAAEVSHELRTPLTQIRLLAELLQTDELSPEDRVRWSRTIDRESRRLTYLVENVLNLSRTEANALRVVLEETDVGAELTDICNSFEPLADTRGVRLRVEAGEGISLKVDRRALRQMVINLLDNAVKYGPAGQTVTVRLHQAHDAVRIVIDDEGPGVPAADRYRIWEPYRRLDRDAASTTVGTGIGLAIVRELAGLHGGRVWVEDVPPPARGARFVIELPAPISEGVAWHPSPNGDDPVLRPDAPRARTVAAVHDGPAPHDAPMAASRPFPPS